MSVLILVTGGTFDKEYNELNGALYFKETHIPDMLKLGRSHVAVRVQTLMMKDSLDMTDEDRRQILEAIREASETQIVITHGTDTMENTAQFLGKAAITHKTIVLIGAMIPYAFGSSDGLFNLGSGLAYAQSLNAGVYVAMNGQHFHWDHVYKDRSAGVFRNKTT